MVRERIVTFGGTRFDWRVATTTSLWALLCLAILFPASQIPYTKYWRKESLYCKEWVVNLKNPPPGDALAIVGIVLLFAAALGFGFALYWRDMPGKRFSRGVFFGIALWAVSIEGEFMALRTDLMPSYVHLVLWIGLGLLIMVIIGIVLSYVYPRRYRYPPPGIEVLAEGRPRRWSETFRELWGEKWALLASAIIAFFFTVGLFAFYFYTFKPFSWVPWLYPKTLQQGHLGFVTIIYEGLVVAAWSMLFTIFYAVVRRSGPFEGVTSGVFFGIAAYCMFTLPFMLIFFPVNTVPTKFIVPTLLVLPLVIYIGMGAINGWLLDFAGKRRN